MKSFRGASKIRLKWDSLKALSYMFEHFYTPTNDTLLFNDLEQNLIIKDEIALETSDIEVEQRLSHPEGNYYKRKETTN